MTMKSRNPATEKVWAESAELDEKAIDERLLELVNVKTVVIESKTTISFTE